MTVPASAGSAPPSVWPWLVIVAASLSMAASAMLLPGGALPDAGKGSEDPAAESGSRTTLAILEFQAKNLVGLSVLPGTEELQEAVDQLKASVAGGNPRAVGSVAALEAFAGFGDNSREDALAFIDTELSRSEATGKLLATIRRAIAAPASVSDDEWQWLEDELGWFGELLAALEGGPQAERAEEIRESGKRLATRLIVGVLTLVAAGVVGAVLLFLAIYYASYQRFPLRLQVPGSVLARIMLESFAVYLSVMAAADLVVTASLMLPDGPAIVDQVVGWLSLAALPLSIVLAFAWAGKRLAGTDSGLDLRGFCRALGLHRGAGLLKEVGCGLLGYVAMLPVVAFGIMGTGGLILLSEWLSDAEDGGSGDSAISHPIVEWMAGGDVRVMLLALFLAAVVAPLFEETMFRGAFHGALRGRWRFWGAALISALVFAMVHPQGVLLIPALGAMGFGFSMIREWRGSLIAPMTAHALHNGMLVGVMWMAFGR